MTEDEAKTKWCPQARVRTYSSDQAPAHNRWKSDDGRFGSPIGCACIASACMAWRTTSSQHGYCGLAGRPRV